MSISSKSILSITLLAATCCGLSAMESEPLQICNDKVYAKNELHGLSLKHDRKGFIVEDEMASRRVQNCFVDKDLRGKSREELTRYLAHNYVAVKQMGDTYKITGEQRLDGSGPIGFAICYYGTKAICYVTLGAAIVGTAGTAGVAIGAVAAGTAIATGVGGAATALGVATATGVGVAETTMAFAGVEAAAAIAGGIGALLPF